MENMMENVNEVMETVSTVGEDLAPEVVETVQKWRFDTKSGALAVTGFMAAGAAVKYAVAPLIKKGVKALKGLRKPKQGENPTPVVEGNFVEVPTEETKEEPSK